MICEKGVLPLRALIMAGSILGLALVVGPAPAQARGYVGVGIGLNFGVPVYGYGYAPYYPGYYAPPVVYAPPVYAPAPPLVYAPPLPASAASPVYQAANGQFCREYQTTVVVNGAAQPAYGTACRGPDGVWRVVN